MYTEGRLRRAAAPPAVPRELGAWPPPALLLRAPRAMLACGGSSTPRPRPSQLVFGRTPEAQTSSLTLRAGNVLAKESAGWYLRQVCPVLLWYACGPQADGTSAVVGRAICNLQGPGTELGIAQSLGLPVDWRFALLQHER